MHLKELYESLKLDLRPLFSDFRWGITAEIEKELEHYQLGSFFSWRQGYQVPVSEQEIDHFQQMFPTIKEYDLADQTLLIVGKRDHAIILTDDGGLYLECQAMGIRTLLLAQFLLALARDGALEKSEVYRALRFWESVGRYPKREIKKWYKILAEI